MYDGDESMNLNKGGMIQMHISSFFLCAPYFDTSPIVGLHFIPQFWGKWDRKPTNIHPISLFIPSMRQSSSQSCLGERGEPSYRIDKE